MIVWTRQFETGYLPIDLQHRMLIENVNHLEAQLTNSNPTRAECELLMHLVDFLQTYADVHFELEEQCMECKRCTDQARNRQAHESYRLIFRNYQARSKNEGFNPKLIRELHESASLWVQQHILKIDIQLRDNLHHVCAD